MDNRRVATLISCPLVTYTILSLRLFEYTHQWKQSSEEKRICDINCTCLFEMSLSSVLTSWPLSCVQCYLATSSFLKLFPLLTSETGCFLLLLSCLWTLLTSLLPVKYACPLDSILNLPFLTWPLSPMYGRSHYHIYIVNSQISFPNPELCPKS